jgi:hypothetical protein
MLAAAATLIALSILLHPNNHDEGQYVAAVALMRTGLPYRDFAYLQTPLQPLVLSPLCALPAGWLLIAMRGVNGVLGMATIRLLFQQLHGRVSWRSAVIAAAALACTGAFLLAASQARNDGLPMLLLTGGQGVLLARIEQRGQILDHGIAGLLFGLAASAKINAALPAAGAGLYVVLQVRRNGVGPLLAFLGGVSAGLLPCALSFAIAPEQFRFDVFEYGFDAPTQWWTSVGEAHILSPLYRVGRLLLMSLPGIIAVGLAARICDRGKSEDRRFLDLLVVGGIVSSYLPEPAYAQYLVPLLPALTARFALAIDDFSGAKRHIATVAVFVAALCGLGTVVGYALRAWDDGPDLLKTVRGAEALSKLAAGRRVATLSPERVAGSNVNLDSRFATGPFLFRTMGRLSADAQRYGGSPNWQRIDQAFERQPPAVIVIGGEARPFRPLFPHGLDTWLQAWALNRGYQRVALPGGDLTAFVERAKVLRTNVGWRTSGATVAGHTAKD